MKVVSNGMIRDDRQLFFGVDHRVGQVLAGIGRLVGFLVVVVLIVGTGASAAAQNTSPKSQSVAAPDDRSAIRVRYPMPEKLSDFQTDRDYRYDHEAAPPENPVGRFFYWLYSKLMRFLRSESYQTVWQYVILAGVAAFVIYLLMKAEVLGFIFSKKAKSDELLYENLSENIHEIDFDTAIEEAINQRNFRQAVRLLYLQTLKRLTNSGLIDYKPDKTNRQYSYELAHTPLQTSFDNLTRQFEFIWYGDFPIDDHQFATLRSTFRDFSIAQLQNVR